MELTEKELRAIIREEIKAVEDEKWDEILESEIGSDYAKFLKPDEYRGAQSSGESS
jgi:hypothetical protein